VGLVGKCFSAISASLSEVDRDGEGGGARRDVDGRSTSEVVTSVEERPAFRVPSPACDGVINESGPHKDKEKKGAEVRTFGETSNSDHWSVGWRLALAPHGPPSDEHLRDSREHQLVNAENDGWNACTSNGGFFENTLHTEIFCAKKIEFVRSSSHVARRVRT
jgi:hypothetical protein